MVEMRLPRRKRDHAKKNTTVEEITSVRTTKNLSLEPFSRNTQIAMNVYSRV